MLGIVCAVHAVVCAAEAVCSVCCAAKANVCVVRALCGVCYRSSVCFWCVQRRA